VLFRTPPSPLEPVRSFWLTIDRSKLADIVIRLRLIRRIIPPPDCSPERGMQPTDRPRDKPVFPRSPLAARDYERLSPAGIAAENHRLMNVHRSE
jgi:hypothetical protein